MTIRLLVTGGSGFIGSWCLRQLVNEPIEIFVISRKARQNLKNITWVTADFLEPEQMKNVVKQVQATHLLHCAWDVTHNYYWQNLNNIDYYLATVLLWEEFIKNGGTRGIFLGSGAELLETNVQPNTLYGRGKKLTAESVAFLGQAHGVEYLWCRVFGLFGQGEPSARLFPYLLKCFRDKIPPEIKSPETKYDFLYVENLAKLIKELSFSQLVGIVDLGLGDVYSVRELAIFLHQCFYPTSPEPIYFADASPNSFLPDLTWQQSIQLKAQYFSFKDAVQKYLEQDPVTILES